MSASNVTISLAAHRRKLAEATSCEEVLATFCQYIGELFGCDYVSISYDSEDPYRECYSKEGPKGALKQGFLKIEESQIYCRQEKLSCPLFVSDVSRSRVSTALASALTANKILSYGLVPIFSTQGLLGFIECHFTKRYFRWRREDSVLLEQIAEHCALCIENVLKRKGVAKSFHEELHEAKLQFKKVAEYGHLIIIKTDPEFKIIDVIGDSESLLGIKAEKLLTYDNAWAQFVNPDDLRHLGRHVRRMGKDPSELKGEIRIRNRKTQKTHWLMLKAIPYFSADNEFLGWEGYGVDITEKRLSEDKITAQQRRIEALYEVSSVLQVNMDPAQVTLKGLQALLRATNSDAGFGCFYDEDSGELEIVAADGLSQEYLDNLSKLMQAKTLVRYVVENKEGLRLDNIQTDTRAVAHLAQKENLKSAILMPLLIEDRVLGAMVIYSRRPQRYDEADFDLVAAAASQISLVALQAEYYSVEKRHADSVAVLYRLSHELSRLFTAKDVAEHAFPIIREELACKRMWLGVINEQNTHIVGQGGYGPGVRRRIKEIQIELDLQHDFLDTALKTKEAVVVPKGQEMECSGLNRVINKLDIGTFIIVPLVSLGQTVGVFLVEPAMPSKYFMQRKLPLLNGMANEIATVILARRFEAKIADADKMRMAGLLASGVAHNFNNLLQAVMGQASLIEMQLPEDSPLSGSARTIIEAASRGAALIKQLLTFSMQEGFQKKRLLVPRLLEDSRELYTTLLGSIIMLELDFDRNSPDIYGDYGQVQQIITNLLMNAREAIGSNCDGMVRIHTSSVRLRSGEVDPELAPGEYLRIDIEDNGVGMDAERQARCFEPFFTTKDVDRNTGIGLGGSGLGLSSAYSMAKQHGGVITVNSSPGEGTIVSAFLPACSTSEVLEEVEEEVVQDLPPVLIFNLDDSVAYSVGATLQSFGLSSRVVSNKEEAMQLISSSEKIRLFIVDIERLGKGVFEFIESISKKNPELKIILSTIDRLTWSSEFVDFPQVSVVEKPVGIWAIHSVVRELLPLGRRAALKDKVIVEAREQSKPREVKMRPLKAKSKTKSSGKITKGV